MTIGERIKQRREELGYSQDELAKKTGYKSRSSINKIELSRDLPLNKVELMAKALEVEPAYLMGWTVEHGDEFVVIDYQSSDIRDNRHLLEYAKRLGDENMMKAIDLYDLYQKASPEARKAVEVLLKFEPPQA